MTALRVLAPAKINLVLRILDRREDGYHDLDTLFQAISLGDEVTLVPGDGPGIDFRVEGADVGPTEQNLAFRAARAWSAATGIDPRIRIQLTKRVPAGAGLGGGSSDAGAVLRGLEAMHGALLGVEGISRIGAELGADVPFFCGVAGLARGEGIGERLTPLPALPERDLVVAVPAVPVPTAGAYGWLASARESAARAPRASGEGGPQRLETLADPTGAPTWADIDRIASNDFHTVVADQVPEVARLIERLEDAGLEGVMLSGSGSAVFGFLPRATDGSIDPDGRRVAVDRITRHVRAELSGVRTFAATTLGTIPGPETLDTGEGDRP
ncbi:MAG TPA: 4-(cytidine 5'-diphospho)-2-C-methyl-D-erythritol kinase [Longimicrobiales bacterium]|nr:4-(cytidine 5'-diphospho)-2-C-methyl-D-erythritol kinase [Longimicrobiales bacterium]